MRILLFAYEFAPVASAQSLRWHYLTRELVRSGFEVDVVTARLEGLAGVAPFGHPGLRVVRTFPGPVVGLSRRVAMARYADGFGGNFSGDDPLRRFHRAGRRLLDHVIAPDVRTEWFPFAWTAARRLLRSRRYDAVISSHEPGVDLLLGLRVKGRLGLPWVVDLADPLVAPYTPRWRRVLDEGLERRVCRRADAVLVTNPVLRARLCRRHRLAEDKVHLVCQGFDPRPADVPPERFRDLFQLVFTGTLYPFFREPGALLEAVRRLPDVHLAAAGDVGPFVEAFRRLAPRVTLLGKVSHEECLRLQRRAAVLVNVGNRQADQVPGKIYEYLGAGRPILHLSAGGRDPAAELLRRTGRGISVPAEPAAVEAALASLLEAFRSGGLRRSFDPQDERVREYSWPHLARHVGRILAAFR